MFTLKTNMNNVLTPIIIAVNDFKPGTERFDNVLREVALDALGNVKSRIHQHGLASDGNIIGQYSKEPMYASTSGFGGNSFGRPVGKPRGTKVKNKYATFSYEDANGNEIIKREKIGSETVDISGRSKFKSTGQDHKSRYFKEGYFEYKTKIGYNVLGTVNLSLSGQLDTQLTIIATDKGYGLGWLNDEMPKRAEALEKKYKKSIWGLTDEEKEKAANVAQQKTNDAFS